MATVIRAKRKPRKKSVLKAIRQAARGTVVNRANRTRLRTSIKNLRAALGAGNWKKAGELLPSTLSLIDRSVRKGTLHPNTAARTKSRLQLRFNALVASGGAAAAS